MSEAPRKPVRAGIVVTGTEVITGTIQDKNGPWISQKLASLGVEVSHIIVVADRPDDLEQLVCAFWRAFDANSCGVRHDVIRMLTVPCGTDHDAPVVQHNRRERHIAHQHPRPVG